MLGIHFAHCLRPKQIEVAINIDPGKKSAYKKYFQASSVKEYYLRFLTPKIILISKLIPRFL